MDAKQQWTPLTFLVRKEKKQKAETFFKIRIFVLWSTEKTMTKMSLDRNIVSVDLHKWHLVLHCNCMYSRGQPHENCHWPQLLSQAQPCLSCWITGRVRVLKFCESIKPTGSISVKINSLLTSLFTVQKWVFC